MHRDAFDADVHGVEGIQDPFAGARSTWRRDQARRRAAASAAVEARPEVDPAHKQVILELGRRVHDERAAGPLLDPMRQKDLARKARLGMTSMVAGLLVVVLVALVVTTRRGDDGTAIELASASTAPTTAVTPDPASDPATPDPSASDPAVTTVPADLAPPTTAPVVTTPAQDPALKQLASTTPPLLAAGTALFSASSNAMADGSVNFVEAALLQPLIEAITPVAQQVAAAIAAIPAIVDQVTAQIVAFIDQLVTTIERLAAQLLTIVRGVVAAMETASTAANAGLAQLQKAFDDLGREFTVLFG